MNEIKTEYVCSNRASVFGAFSFQGKSIASVLDRLSLMSPCYIPLDLNYMLIEQKVQEITPKYHYRKSNIKQG